MFKELGFLILTLPTKNNLQKKIHSFEFIYLFFYVILALKFRAFTLPLNYIPIPQRTILKASLKSGILIFLIFLNLV